MGQESVCDRCSTRPAWRCSRSGRSLPPGTITTCWMEVLCRGCIDQLRTDGAGVTIIEKDHHRGDTDGLENDI